MKVSNWNFQWHIASSIPQAAAIAMKLTQAFQKEDRILAREVQANKKVYLKSNSVPTLKIVYRQKGKPINLNRYTFCLKCILFLVTIIIVNFNSKKGGNGLNQIHLTSRYWLNLIRWSFLILKTLLFQSFKRLCCVANYFNDWENN